MKPYSANPMAIDVEIPLFSVNGMDWDRFLSPFNARKPAACWKYQVESQKPENQHKTIQELKNELEIYNPHHETL